DLLERYLLRPGILQAFGWNVITVFTKDWWHDRDGVLRRIERALAGESPVPAEAAADPVELEPEPETTLVEDPPIRPAAPGFATTDASPAEPAAPAAEDAPPPPRR